MSVDAVMWLVLAVSCLGLLCYLAAALINPEKW